MILKPRKTILNPKAILFKRFISIEKSVSLSNVFYTVDDAKYWVFDYITMTMQNVDIDASLSNVINVVSGTTVLDFGGTYLYYLNYEWLTLADATGYTLTTLGFNNIAKYQTNKYVNIGEFDYIIEEEITESTTQYLKGNIMPLVSFNIKYFNDDLHLTQDDLVVIKGHLYSVERPITAHKHFPKDYNIYYATLNCIL